MACAACGSNFISTARYTSAQFIRSLCHPPSRASKKSHGDEARQAVAVN
ncbi:FlhC family transcriptional regulator [Candidatus Pantoea persica]